MAKENMYSPSQKDRDRKWCRGRKTRLENERE